LALGVLLRKTPGSILSIKGEMQNFIRRIHRS
jgi:hypothetical protein